MNSKITNALFRIEGISGKPSLPFEKPRDDLDLWVLELESVCDSEMTISDAIKQIEINKPFFDDFKSQNLRVVLHLAIEDLGSKPFKIEPDLMELCSLQEISIEITN